MEKDIVAKEYKAVLLIKKESIEKKISDKTDIDVDIIKKIERKLDPMHRYLMNDLKEIKRMLLVLWELREKVNCELFLLDRLYKKD